MLQDILVHWVQKLPTYSTSLLIIVCLLNNNKLSTVYISGNWGQPTVHSVMTSLGRQTDCPSQLAASALATVQSPVSFVSCQSLIYALCISAFSLIVLFEIFKRAYTLSTMYVSMLHICKCYPWICLFADRLMFIIPFDHFPIIFMCSNSNILMYKVCS